MRWLENLRLNLRTREARRLSEHGMRCIREHDYERALKFAGELRKLRHSSTFELEALARAGLGDVEGAVRALQDGVAKAPTVWLNWQLLGNRLSDLERYDEAAVAYARALQCPDVHESSLHLNQAILASRRKQLPVEPHGGCLCHAVLQCTDRASTSPRPARARASSSKVELCRSLRSSPANFNARS